MKTIILNDQKYTLEANYKDCFDYEKTKEKHTDYFDEYDYILGDYSYDRLRLKGFYDVKNPKVKDLNNIENLDNHLKNYCAYNCGYFLLKKIKETVE